MALNRYIENRFDKDVWKDLKQFSHEREVFEADKTAFTTYAEKERLYLNAFSSELEDKLKAIETREKNMVDKEEKMQKQKEE